MVIAKRLSIYVDQSWVPVDGDEIHIPEYMGHKWEIARYETIEEWKPWDSELTIQPMLRHPTFLRPTDIEYTARDIFGRGNKFLN